MRSLGVDVGSRYVKFAVYDGGLAFTSRIDTVTFYRRCRLTAEEGGGVELSRLDLFEGGMGQFDVITATGYGRHNVKINGATVISEIKAHATGAVHQTGLSDFTLIDLGGQDSKVVKVENRAVADFVMNDKCAAGSGRYLENIATMLGMTPEELGDHYADPVKLSVTCAIFGESEVVGLLAEGVRFEELCAGANLSVAQRVLSMMKHHPSDNYVISGGVAKNRAVVRFIIAKCGGRVVVPEEPIFNGALGAAISGCSHIVAV